MWVLEGCRYFEVPPLPIPTMHMVFHVTNRGSIMNVWISNESKTMNIESFLFQQKCCFIKNSSKCTSIFSLLLESWQSYSREETPLPSSQRLTTWPGPSSAQQTPWCWSTSSSLKQHTSTWTPSSLFSAVLASFQQSRLWQSSSFQRWTQVNQGSQCDAS